MISLQYEGISMVINKARLLSGLLYFVSDLFQLPLILRPTLLVFIVNYRRLDL